MGRYGILQFVFSLHQYEQPMLYALFGPGHQADPNKKTTAAPPTGADDLQASQVSTEIVGPGVRTEIVLKF